MLMVVETGGFLALTFLRHPLAAWAFAGMSLTALAWLIADHRAMGSAAITVTPDHVDLRIGRRSSARVLRSADASSRITCTPERPAGP